MVYGYAATVHTYQGADTEATPNKPPPRRRNAVPRSRPSCTAHLTVAVLG
jgi:hypothetical protein